MFEMPHSITRRSFVAGSFMAAVPARSAWAVVPPLRVASMDYALAEIAIGLGQPPFAVAGAADWDKWVVAPPLPPGTIDVGDSQTANFEFLARLKPDLILTTPYLDPILAVLQRIGPVLRISIYEDGAAPLPRAEGAVRILGERLGREGEARDYLAKADADFTALAARARAFDGQSVAAISFIDGRHVRIYGGNGLFQGALDRIGIANSYKGPANYWGFETLGVERLAPLDVSRFLVIDPMPPDSLPTLARSPLWSELPAVAAGKVSVLPAALMFGGVASALRFARLVVDELERTAA